METAVPEAAGSPCAAGSRAADPRRDLPGRDAQPGLDNRATLRSFCGDLAALLRAVEFRDLEGGLSCVMGFGSDAWDRSLGRRGRQNCIPSGRFAPERAMRSPRRATCCSTSAPSAWIYASSWPRKSWRGSENAVSPVDEVHGFRYFDDRDLMGFVDGTENPRGAAAIDAVLIGEEDAAFAGGSYVIVQKYLHDLDAWNALSTEAQERIIGRTKLSDIELDDSVKPTSRTTRSPPSSRTERDQDPARQHALRPARAW
jgi:putative iron-dependent peroxidase